MPVLFINSIRDLLTYIADRYPTLPDQERDAVRWQIMTDDSRPRFGQDWRSYLDSVDGLSVVSSLS